MPDDKLPPADPAKSSLDAVFDHIHQLAPNFQRSDILALIAALSEGEVARNAYCLWRDQLDWENIPVTALRILPLLHHNISRLKEADPLLDRIKGVRRYMWARNLWLVTLAKLIHGEFARAGVPALALKGTSLVASRVVDRTVRPMEDVDILVRDDQIRTAIDVLKAIGFRPLLIDPRVLIEEVVPDYRWSGWAFINDSNQQIDLHWSVLAPRPDGDLSSWSHSTQVNFEGVDIRILCRPDQLIHTCVHGARDTDVGAIRWILDAIFIVRGTRLDWSYLIESAAHHRVSAILANSFEIINAVAPGHIPNRTITTLKRNRTWDERIELRSIRLAPGSSNAGIAGTFLAFQKFRRSLSSRSTLRVLAAWLKRKYGTRNSFLAVLRAGYFARGCPQDLRHILCTDRGLETPRVKELKCLDAGRYMAHDLDTRSFLTGWSIGEKGGRWTDGPSASLAVRLRPPDTDVTVALIVDAAVAAGHPEMRVRIFVDGHFDRSWVFTIDDQFPATLTFRRLTSNSRAEQPTIITIESENPMIPRSVGLSSDIRELGLFLREVHVSPAVK